MSVISYLGARSACLPIVGPFISLGQLVQLDEDIKRIKLLDSADRVKLSFSSLSANFNAINGIEEGIEETELLIDYKREELLNRYSAFHAKGRINTISGIVGCLLTNVILISAVAFAFFQFESKRVAPVAMLTLAAIFFSGQILFLDRQLAHHNKNIDYLSNERAKLNF